MLLSLVLAVPDSVQQLKQHEAVLKPQ